MSEIEHIKDLPGAVHKAVGPSRTAAYAIVASSDPALPASAADARKIMKSRLRTAQQMLSSGLSERFSFKGSELKLPKDLDNLRRAALEAVENMLAHSAITAPERALTEDARIDLATSVAPAVEQSATGFLAAFDEWFRETDDAGHSERRRKIVEASDDIGKISRAINMISINASIEASRAGEAGRGFAIIANEIRGLSEKTQASLEKIMGALDDAGMGER